MTNTIKALGNCCLIFIAVISVGISLVYGYYHCFIHDVTLGVNYIDNQIGLDIKNAKDLTETEKNELEERYFLEANYYSNAKHNGEPLQELKLNYFTDYNLMSTGYRASGMQYLGDLKQEDLKLTPTTEEQANRDEPKGFCYYDTTNGISWDGGKLRTQLNRESTFVISIDNKPYQIQLDKTYDWTTYQRQWYTLWIWNKPTTHTVYYNFLNVFADCMQAIRTNSAGYGDYYITVDLSEYFTIRAFDPETGKFKADDVTDIIKTYSVLKFHYDENGARNSTQSMFGCIDCNPSYDITEEQIDTTYWQERFVYTLTNKDLELRYSDVYDGYFAALSIDTKTLFANMPRSKVNVIIDMNEEKQIVGINYNSFENFEIDTLTINGEGTFYLLNKALFNTNIQTIQHSNNLVLDFATDATNNTFSEVAI